MTPLEALQRITKFTEDSIAPLLLMRKEVRHSGDILDNTEEEVELVHPAVCWGTIPHKNFQPLDFQCPMILWTFDTVNDDRSYDEGREVHLIASCSSFSSDLYSNSSNLPDNKAFGDMANLLETMYQKLTEKHVVNGVGIKDRVSYGIYDGAFYPYSYGYLTLTAEIARMQYDDEIF